MAPPASNGEEIGRMKRKILLFLLILLVMLAIKYAFGKEGPVFGVQR